LLFFIFWNLTLKNGKDSNFQLLALEKKPIEKTLKID